MRERGLERVFLSYPALFKHLAFDGSFLHGVPEIMLREGCPSEKGCRQPTDRLGGGGIEGGQAPVPSCYDKANSREDGEMGLGPAKEVSTRSRVTIS